MEYNDMNPIGGQIGDASGQHFMPDQRPELRGHFPSGSVPYPDVLQPLRRPHGPTNPSNDSKIMNDLTRSMANSSIGGAGDIGHAGPWMPPPGAPHSPDVRNRLPAEPKDPTAMGTSSLVSNLSPFAKEFVPRTTMSYSPAPAMPNGLNSWHQMPPIHDNREFDDFIALSYLREFIDTITIKPNKYDSGIDYLTEVLNTYIDEDETVMDSVVNIIVDQAIVEPQFRYNGVRLCIHLMEKLVVLSEEKDFKKLLLRRCQREFSRRDNLIRSSSTADYLRGLTLFIGDLYSRLGSEELAQILPQLLLTLLSKPEKENLKCICQVLKLCGSPLECHFKNTDSDDFNKVIEELKVCSEHKDVSPYVKELMTNIIEMQKRGWTTNMSSAATSNPVVNPYLNANPQETNWNNGPEYYEEYTNFSDEEEFLHQASYDFGQCGDEEDNEVCEAFEEFLKNSGQTK